MKSKEIQELEKVHINSGFGMFNLQKFVYDYINRNNLVCLK